MEVEFPFLHIHGAVVVEYHDLDLGLNVEAATKSEWIEDETQYHILHVSDCATLTHGFRY
jgi:hypothetical protein